MLSQLFSGRQQDRSSLFIPYITAGDPDLSCLPDQLLGLQHSGADLIELGIPFSDPCADGPVIQASCQRALSSGFRMEDLFRSLKQARTQGFDCPLILFGYLNPFLSFGMERLVVEAKELGIYGLLILDLPAEGSDIMRRFLQINDLDLIYLITPTTSESRRQSIYQVARGFVYAVARTGVTGRETEIDHQYISMVKKECPVPVAVGFGVSQPEHVRALSGRCDGVVVGSAIVKRLHSDGLQSTMEYVKTLTAELR